MRAQATDEIYIEASPRDIIDILTRLSADASWWPGARVRGEYGWVEISAPSGRPFGRVRFRADIGAVREWEGFTWMLVDGELIGRAEWWIEAFKDGSIVHLYIDCERGPRGRWRRRPTILRRYRWAMRRGLNGLKDALASGSIAPRPFVEERPAGKRRLPAGEERR